MILELINQPGRLSLATLNNSRLTLKCIRAVSSLLSEQNLFEVIDDRLDGIPQPLAVGAPLEGSHNQRRDCPRLSEIFLLEKRQQSQKNVS